MFKKKPLPAGAPQPAGAEGASEAGSRRKLFMILGLALLSFVAIGGGLVAAIGPAGLRAMLFADPVAEELAAPQQEDVSPPPPPGADLVVMAFDEMIVNISATTESGRQTSRFLKLDLALVYDRKQDPEGLVETRHIFLRDAFQDYLRQLADRDLDGTHGLVTVKGELLRRARAVAGSKAPHEVLVTGLVIQ